MTIGLVLGDLDLMDSQGSPFAVETLAEGTDWGNPQPIEVAVRSLLQDGSIVVHQGDDNREVALRVVITAPDSAALAEGEAALMAELYRANTLTYTPADGWGPPTVFTVITSSLAHTMDDLGEVRGQRTWSVRLVCEPFGRSVDEVDNAAPAPPPPGAPTVVVINDGSATTGWTSSSSLTSDGNYVENAYAEVSGWNTHWLQWSGAAVDMSTTPYLQIDYRTFHSSTTVTVTADGVALEYVGSQVVGAYTRATYLCPDTSITTVRITVSHYVTAAFFSFLRVDQVRRTDTFETPGTTRESQRTLTVDGSARTQGTLLIEHDTDALGDVLAYTFQDSGNGYSPPLRQYRSSGGSSSPDSSLVSGESDMLDTQLVFDVPAASLEPGRYLLMARLKGSVASAATLTVTARTRVNSTDLDSPISRSALVTVGTGWSIVPLTPLNLPTRDLASASSAMVRITVQDADTSGVDVDLDEAWLFDLERGSLVQVACGTGTPAAGGPSNRLWLLPPSVTSPRPRIFRGFAEDQSDAFYPGSDVGAWGQFTFHPPQMAVFTVTSNAESAGVSLRHFPRWHTHAAS